jgi:YbbR domain-containing protein
MKKFLTENIGLKIAAVFLSIVLWFYVTSRGQSELSLDVPLEFKNIPAGFELVSSNAKAVSLNISGQERLIKNIKPSDIRVYVDLGRAKKGEGTYGINKETVKLPPAASVKNITPSQIRVVIDETVKKVVGVRPVVIGTPGRGYSIKSVEVSPETIEIEGIMSEVRKVYSIRTEPIDITDIKETIYQDFRIDLSSLNIRTKTSAVNVKVVIAGRKK